MKVVILMKKTLFYIILTFSCLSVHAQTRVIAHRGFWSEGSTQNSLESLIRADSLGCYGSEFDVRMSKDGQLVVVHDLILKGKVVSRTSAKKLTKIRLKNGETLPLLSDFLQKGKETDVRLILELKKLKNAKKETEAIQKITKMVRELNLEDRMEYISFSLHAVEEFIRMAPEGTPIYYLKGDLSPQELKSTGCAGADYKFSVYREHPEWIAEFQSLGIKTNVWTVDKQEDFEWFIERGIDFITTNTPHLLQQLIEKK